MPTKTLFLLEHGLFLELRCQDLDRMSFSLHLGSPEQGAGHPGDEDNERSWQQSLELLEFLGFSALKSG